MTATPSTPAAPAAPSAAPAAAALPQYGQVAYEAYGDRQNWKTFSGSPMPKWAEVRDDIKTAWEQAAKAVHKALVSASFDAHIAQVKAQLSNLQATRTVTLKQFDPVAIPAFVPLVPVEPAPTPAP